MKLPFKALAISALAIIAVLIFLVLNNPLQQPTGQITLADSTDFSADKGQWNIVVISLDTLRADYLGSYGYYRNTSRNIDSFAKESVLFENAYSQTNWTLPSHTSIFTSQYPGTHRVFTRESIIPDSSTLLSEALKNKGYSNYGFVGGGFVSAEYGFGRGFDSYKTTKGKAKAVFSSAIEFLDSNAAGQKFFLFLHAYQPHAPYFAEENPFSAGLKGFTPIDANEANKTTLKILNNENPGAEELGNYCVFLMTNPMTDLEEAQKFMQDANSLAYFRERNIFAASSFAFTEWGNTANYTEQLSYLKTSYASTIYDADYWFGKFIQKMGEKGMLDKTIIVLLSDHGEAFMEHKNLLHNKTLFNEEIHIPLIIHFPSGKSTRVKDAIELIDVAPTILDLVGIVQPNSFEGKSLLPKLEGNEEFSRAVFSEEHNGLGSRQTAVVSGEWKLIRGVDGAEHMFNLVEDPGEKTELQQQMPEKAEELSGFIDAFVSFNEMNAAEAKTQPGSQKELLSQLIALGYFDAGKEKQG